MVHLHSTATLLAVLSVVHSALGGDTATAPKPQGSGSGSGTDPTFHVLTGTHQQACTPEQVDILKTRLAETATLAKAASTALKVNGAEHSDAFTKFLGNANPKEMDAQHYTPVLSLESVDLKSVTSDKGHELEPKGVKATAPPTETLLTCYPKSEPMCMVNGKSTGMTAAANTRTHSLGLCPAFFEEIPNLHPTLPSKPLSLAEGKASWLAGTEGWKLTGASILLHELQHLHPVVGKHMLEDLYVKHYRGKTPGAPARVEVVPRPKNFLEKTPGISGCYRKKDCIAIPQDKKALNAENFALYAMEVYANADRANADSTTANPKASDNAKKTRTLKRFEAVYERRADMVTGKHKQI